MGSQYEITFFQEALISIQGAVIFLNGIFTCDVLVDFTHIDFACRSPFACSQSQDDDRHVKSICVNSTKTSHVKLDFFLYKRKQVRTQKNAGKQATDNLSIMMS